MDRREFVTSAAAAAVAASTGPTLLGMTRKAGEEHPVIGAGEHKYECHHNWGQLPPDYAWQTTHNVAVDSQGLVYITHQGIGLRSYVDWQLKKQFYLSGGYEMNYNAAFKNIQQLKAHFIAIVSDFFDASNNHIVSP